MEKSRTIIVWANKYLPPCHSAETSPSLEFLFFVFFSPREHSAVAQTSTFGQRERESERRKTNTESRSYSLKCLLSYMEVACMSASARPDGRRGGEKQKKFKSWVSRWVSDWAINRAIGWVIQHECEREEWSAPADWQLRQLTDCLSDWCPGEAFYWVLAYKSWHCTGRRAGVAGQQGGVCWKWECSG